VTGLFPASRPARGLRVHNGPVTHDPVSRDEAGRALYAERSTLLPGLGHPPALPWAELDETVRERWRRQAEASAPVRDTSGIPRGQDQARARHRAER